MSQQQGEHPEDSQRGQYVPHRGYGHDQGYPQNYGNPGGYDQPPYGYDQGRSHEQGYGQGGYGYDSSYGPGQQAADQGYQQAYGDQNYSQYGSAQPGHEPGGYGAGRLAASLTLDDGSNRHYQLTEGSTVVGRGQDAQFRLPDTGVSRRHLEITWDGWTATLADLGSTNGTTVNGTPVQTWQLADGDVVRVGHSSLVFRTQG